MVDSEYGINIYKTKRLGAVKKNPEMLKMCS